MFSRPISGFDIFIFICREGMSMRADRNTFLYDPDHRLLFCRNAKVSDALSEQILFCIQLQTHLQAGVGHMARCVQMSTAVHIHFNIY